MKFRLYLRHWRWLGKWKEDRRVLGKAIDDQSGDPVGTSYNPTTSTAIDNNNLRLDRGRADFDHAQVRIVLFVLVILGRVMKIQCRKCCLQTGKRGGR